MEGPSQRLQLFPDFMKIVDLPIIYDPPRLVLTGHWLISGRGKIQDRQPLVPETDSPSAYI